MLNCWSEFADKRPAFPDLVREFDRMITMVSDKVNVIIRTKMFRDVLISLELSSCHTFSITTKTAFIQHTCIRGGYSLLPYCVSTLTERFSIETKTGFADYVDKLLT